MQKQEGRIDKKEMSRGREGGMEAKIEGGRDEVKENWEGELNLFPLNLQIEHSCQCL